MAMTSKRIGKPVRRLSVVERQSDSPAKDSPASQSEPQPSGKERMMAGLARAHEARRAAGRKADEARARGEVNRITRFRSGDYPVSDWEDEEVSKGRPRNLDGTFAGQHPTFTGRQLQQIKAELLRRGQRDMDGMFKDAVKVLHQIATSGDSDAARVKAANLLIERVAGRVPEKIEIKSSDPWQDILDEIMDDDVLTRMTPEPSDAEAQ